MSFLAGRLAATEGAFFSQTSKQALTRLKDKLNTNSLTDNAAKDGSKIVQSSLPEAPCNADVLPEILQHSPVLTPAAASSSTPSSYSPPPSSLAAALTPSSPSLAHPQRRADSSNPLIFFAGVPQTSLGPRRWKPERDDSKTSWSTANEAKMEENPPIDPARAQALMEGYSIVLKAFFVATAIVTGAATACVAATFSSLEIRSIEDIRIKGQEHMQSRAEAIQQRMNPWKQWVLQLRQKWTMHDDSKYKAFGATVAESFKVEKRK